MEWIENYKWKFESIQLGKEYSVNEQAGERAEWNFETMHYAAIENN